MAPQCIERLVQEGGKAVYVRARLKGDSVAAR
jgi:hypothetical protein